MSQVIYEKNEAFMDGVPLELLYIAIMAKKGLKEAVANNDHRQADKFTHILDNVKMLVDIIPKL